MIQHHFNRVTFEFVGGHKQTYEVENGRLKISENHQVDKGKVLSRWIEFSAFWTEPIGPVNPGSSSGESKGNA